MEDWVLAIIISVGFSLALYLMELFFNRGITFSERKSLKPYDAILEKPCDKKDADGYWIGENGRIYYGRKWFLIIDSVKNKKPK